MKRIAAAVVIVLSLWLPIRRAGLACSTVLLRKGKTVLVGHNLDIPDHIPGAVIINKRGVYKEGKSWH